MYTLTLSLGERRAFDFVDGRYETGGMKPLLISECEWEGDWYDDGDITFTIPEPIAWEMEKCARAEHDTGEDYLFPCFAPELQAKLYGFFDGFSGWVWSTDGVI